jgi:hypothetical protein
MHDQRRADGHRLAGRSVLVGDWKQCIFEYAGADPMIMEAVSRWVRDSGGTTETLSRNYRSRPELVEVANQTFAPVFARFGTAASDVVVHAERRRREEQAVLPPLGVFWLEGKSAQQDAACIAEGIARLLHHAEATPMVDRASGAVRALGPGDIAVLAATNAEAQAVACALEQRRIGAALARPGLLATPEGTVIEAALRWLVDPADTLATAVLDALTGWNGLDPDTYLAARIAECASAAAGERATGCDLPGQDSWRRGLESVRVRLVHLAPSEAVLQVLAAVDLATLCARWPEPGSGWATWMPSWRWPRVTSNAAPASARRYKSVSRTLRAQPLTGSTGDRYAARRGPTRNPERPPKSLLLRHR